ncbi:MAG: phytoene desaturase [Acidimicrobiia bacterium]|nr:phytoene desaturase [Acidimicrobiia bacterium]
MGDVVVVGAGLGGLSAACHLAGLGNQVTVVESAADAGGAAGHLEVDGYHFDTGPTVLTMPAIIEATFAAVDADMADFLTLLPVDPMYRACFADGSTIRVLRGRHAMADEIRRTCHARETVAFHRFCNWLTDLYELEMGSFIDRNYRSPLDLLRPARPAVRLLRMGGLRALAPKVASFFADERLRRLFSFQALYAGVSPQHARALFSVITYMDTVGGVYFPAGGMHQVAAGLAAAAQKAGVEFRYSEPVERIVLTTREGGPVRGVLLRSGEHVHADAVVCNVDLPTAYRRLLPGLPAPGPLRRARYSPSAVVWHAGFARAPREDAAHHNIHFGAAWDDAFDALLGRGSLMPDPSILVSAPTRTDASLAPAGHHVAYALEPVPNLKAGIDWHAERPAARERLARRLGALGYGDDPRAEALFDPTDWRRLGMTEGTPFSLSHTFLQSGPFRPPNVDARAPGLAFCGAGTVPGVGVPMVLLSGKLAAERIGSAA